MRREEKKVRVTRKTDGYEGKPISILVALGLLGA